ncbi:unnamed protein product [Sympodiomycopsis kandeliae]
MSKDDSHSKIECTQTVKQSARTSTTPQVPDGQDASRLTTVGKAKKKAGANKKGANPLKAKLKQPSTQASSDSIDQDETGSFITSIEGPLLTLLFSSKQSQHRALARIETYYEGCDPSLQGYISWSDLANKFGNSSEQWGKIAERDLCKGYEAFNFPLRVLVSWFHEMKVQDGNDEAEDGKAWYEKCCLPEEVRLLQYLSEQGVVDLKDGAPSNNSQSAPTAPVDDNTQNANPTDEAAAAIANLQLNTVAESIQTNTPVSSLEYLISITSQNRHTSLQHERLHALYYLSTHYSSTVTEQYRSLSKKSHKIIETDLKLKNYDTKVHIDEWQAYLLEGSHGESTWGKGPTEECFEAKQALRVVAKSEAERFCIDVGI